VAEAAPGPLGGGGEGPPAAAGLVGRGPYRYARWDGRQRLLSLDADELVDAIADDVLADGDVAAALARLFARGLDARGGADARLSGLAELRARLAERRQELLSRFGLGEVVEELRGELEQVVAIERRGLERRLTAGAGGAPEATVAAELAARRQRQLAELPDDLAGRIRGLTDYDFLEPAARSAFDELLDRLRRQVLDSYFAGLAEAIDNATPAALARNREMVRDLKRLLQQRLNGEPADAAEFLARHGAFFPGARDLDEVIDQLAARMAATQSLLASLSADQRRELQQMMDGLLRDDRLRWDLAQLAATLDRLLPDGLGRRYEFAGAEALSLEGALEQLSRLGRIDALSDQLAEVRSPAALDQLDPADLGELLDPAAADNLRALQALARRLEEAGYVERHGDQLQLTARGTRRIGQRVLDELFRRLRRDVFGGHTRQEAGAGSERGEASRPYEFGRPFEVDLGRTLGNALVRGGGRAGRVQLEPGDFEVYETDARSRVATVLLVDMSRSMLLRGCFLAAKKVAIALDALIRARFPHDELHIVGFAYYARQIRPAALATLSWHGYEYGTNLQHGLMLARELLGRSHAANRQVIVVTDGEPTAHFEDGQVEFSYPPTRRTLAETLREVGRCTRAGLTINTFMLERSRALTEFVEAMTRLNRGRAFYATPERLGEYVLVDYVGRRSRAA
jgi:uncharacterized protein with von Willebrand factor type A (vWA) domain